jgi:NADH-quinone oxidoreductase subunit D
MAENYNTTELSDIPVKEEKQYSYLNLGPTHPATHGIFQNVLKMDGEIIMDAVPTIGYIHRAFEKLAERRPFYQITTITDRMNYCSSPINNFGWHMTVEKLLKIEIPKRVQYLRVIIMELARISDHIICNTIIGQDVGATTGFLYLFQYRERIYEIYEEICGARLTTNMGRVGGLERNFTDKTWEKLESFLKDFPPAFEEFSALLERNRIFMDRTINCGPISAERALAYSFSGPNLRAAGVDYDVRVMNPYSSYEEFDFIVPIGTQGDTYDRFMVPSSNRQLKGLRKSHHTFIVQMLRNMYSLRKKKCTTTWKHLSTSLKTSWAKPIFRKVRCIMLLKAVTVSWASI